MWIATEEHSSRGNKQQMQTEVQRWLYAWSCHGTAGKPVANVTTREHRKQLRDLIRGNVGEGRDKGIQRTVLL